jgi:hypothetical protein
MEEYVMESGMKFGPFPAESLIRIEKVPQYTKIQQGMHISEFIYYDQEKKRLISLEAKTSAPNPRSEYVENPKEKFQEYINDIREKWENSLDLYVNMALKKEVPKNFKEIDYASLEILFILVIKNHEGSWLKDVKDALEMSVRSVHRTNKIWKCKVLVINEEMARKKQLIASESV